MVHGKVQVSDEIQRQFHLQGNITEIANAPGTEVTGKTAQLEIKSNSRVVRPHRPVPGSEHLFLEALEQSPVLFKAKKARAFRGIRRAKEQRAVIRHGRGQGNKLVAREAKIPPQITQGTIQAHQGGRRLFIRPSVFTIHKRNIHELTEVYSIAEGAPQAAVDSGVVFISGRQDYVQVSEDEPSNISRRMLTV